MYLNVYVGCGVNVALLYTDCSILVAVLRSVFAGRLAAGLEFDFVGLGCGLVFGRLFGCLSRVCLSNFECLVTLLARVS